MPDEPAPPSAEELHEQELSRRSKREQARALGLDPYGSRTPGIVGLREAKGRYDEKADAAHQAGGGDTRPRVTVAGRVVLLRDTGKLVWLNLRDETGDMQVAVSRKDCEERGFELAKLTDVGDIVVAEGPVMKTRTGEVTVWASSVRPGAKSLVPPPAKHEGLTDSELRYRRRYVDLWANPETKVVFAVRSRIVSRVREIMDAEGYLEVETPMLQALAGGAAARPFRTHLNALGIDVYLRIAPELYLKRLLVGGFSRVYEINRNFRNEGLDKQHNPEFTMLEAYEAFGDVTTMMGLTERLVRESARLVAGEGAELRLPFGETVVDYGPAFDRVAYSDLFERALGFAPADLDRVWREAELRGVTAKYARHLAEEGRAPAGGTLRGRVDDALVVNGLFEAAVEPTLDPGRPTFITDYPSAISPLTRPKPSDPSLSDRADLFIGHMEIAPMYTELNDPDVQAEKFRSQLAGVDEEEATFRTFDEDFVRALKVGMPPAGGMGLGIDRLVMLLTDQRSIRDVLLFPFMRPEGGPRGA